MPKKLISVTPFFFKDLDHKQVSDLLNTQYPIKLKYNEDLVNRVATKYPLIPKSQVVLIIRAIFSSLRDLLVQGQVLNFLGFLFHCRLEVFTHRKGMVIHPAIKIKLDTSPSLTGKNERQ
jgi:nucleoid DNA-binding protein